MSFTNNGGKPYFSHVALSVGVPRPRLVLWFDRQLILARSKTQLGTQPFFSLSFHARRIIPLSFVPCDYRVFSFLPIWIYFSFLDNIPRLGKGGIILRLENLAEKTRFGDGGSMCDVSRQYATRRGRGRT